MNYLLKMLQILTTAYNKTDVYNADNAIPTESFIGRLFAVVDWGFGLIRDNAELLRLWADIDKAEGVVLNRHGEKYGVVRGGANDIFYRLLIKIKILAQLSGGDIETLLYMVSGLYGIPANRVELYEIYPAKVQITIFEDDLPESYDDIKDPVGALTKRLLSGGVGLDMIYKDEAETREHLHIGGRAVSEFTRIRLANRIEELPDMAGNLYIGGLTASEFSRIRLKSQAF